MPVLTYGTLMMVFAFLFLAAYAVCLSLLTLYLVLALKKLNGAEELQQKVVSLSGSLATLRKDYAGLSESYESYVARSAVRKSRDRKREKEEEEEPPLAAAHPGVWFPSLEGGKGA